MSKINIFIGVPELPQAMIVMRIPRAPFIDAMQYEIEEDMRRASFARRYGMGLETALVINACADIDRTRCSEPTK